MPAGLLVFFCHRVPAWVYGTIGRAAKGVANFLLWLVPFSAKVVRVTGWVSLWILILLGPPSALGIAAAAANVSPKGKGPPLL